MDGRVAVRVVGVAGQRDSSGTGTSGYRVQPRAADDVEVLPSASPTPPPTASGSPGPQPTPTPSASSGPVVPIASARAAAKNARLTVRGVVTLASGTVDAGSAVIQDGSGAISCGSGTRRARSRAASCSRSRTRSTKGGMESLRVSIAPRRLGTAADPRLGRFGAATRPRPSRRSWSSSVARWWRRRELPRAGRSASRWTTGAARFGSCSAQAWQRTAHNSPLVRGSRCLASWARRRQAPSRCAAIGSGPVRPATCASLPLRPAPRPRTLPRLKRRWWGKRRRLDCVTRCGRRSGLADLRVGATLVASAWPELEVAGLLWDGSRLVGITPASAARVKQATAGKPTPVSLELGGLRDLGERGVAGIALVSLGDSPGDTVVGSAAPAPPSPTLPAPGDPPSWVSVVGRVTNDGRRQVIEVAGARIVIQRLCERGGRLPEGTVGLIGVATADPPRIIVACDGVRAAPALALVSSEQSGTARRAKTLGAPVDRDLAATPDTGHGGHAAGDRGRDPGAGGHRRPSVRLAEPEAPPAEEGTDPEVSAKSEPRPALVRLPEEHGPE